MSKELYSVDPLAVSEAVEAIRNGTATSQEEDSLPIIGSADRKEVIDAAEVDLDFLAQLVLTEIYSYGYPPLLKAAWQMICNAATATKGKPKYALGIPRGFSKTVWLKLYVLWLILYSDRKFIVVVCNTATHAENFLADVATMLNHPNIKNIFGDWTAHTEKVRQDFKKFSFRGRTVMLAGLGNDSSVRGLNADFVRPDIVVMDDLQSRDEAQNPEVAKELFIWMLGTLMKACHPQKCVFIFVGNMYPFEGSILRKLKAMPEWISYIAAAINADGQSIWPEHRTVEDLLEELANDTAAGHPEIFYAEVMNDEEAGTVSGIDLSAIPILPEQLDKIFAQGGFIVIDPSLAKKKSDDTGIGAVLVYDGIPVLREVISKKLDPGQTIQEATKLAMKYHMQLIIVEAVAYQESLLYWFEKIYDQLGITGITVATISPEGMTKNSRILAMFKQLISGKIMLHRDVRSQVFYQISQYNPLKTNNKDELLDICAYMYKILEMYPHDIPLLIDVSAHDTVEATHTSDLQLAF